MSEETSLQLDFVYGYHGSRCRDNLFYVESGEIVYHIAGVGIVYNQKKHSQRFYLGHNDDIIALTLHPNKKYVATGQIGKDPFIAVWDANTLETVALLKGFHQRGICALGFSNEGKYLVSVGLDDAHTIAIWDWQAGRVIANDKASQDRLFDIEVSPYSNTIVTCGVKHIKFWKYSGNSLISHNGIFGQLGSIQTILCISFGFEDGLCYTGTLNGEVYIWNDNKLVKVVKAHKGPIYAINPHSEGFITCGKDGVLKLWSKDFAPTTQIPIGNYNLRSIDYDNGKIVVGTKESEIFEVVYNGKDKSTPQLLIEGHGEGELWGLASHPSKHLFATASDDKVIKIWNGDTHKGVLTIQGKLEARSCGFSPDGNNLAVGYQNGSFAIYSLADGKELFTKKDRKEEISAIRYSPDGKYLAVGSHDNFVDIYDTSKNNRVGTCQGSSSFITHLDWSANSKLIQTNSGAYEHLYYEIPSCNRLTTKMDNVEWATWTCVLGKNVAGIWPPYSDKTDVNATERSKSGNLLVTGDDFGFVKLFKYPTPEGAKFKKYVGHSAHVTCVRWAHDGSYVVSTGGGDQAVMQWKVCKGSDEQQQQQDTFDDKGTHEEFDSDVEREKEAKYNVKETEDAPFEFTMETEIQAKAAPPSVAKGSGARPTKKPKSGESLSGHVDAAAPPPKALNLEFIFGYRGFDTRDNLFYTASGEYVYHTAATGIVYDPKTASQRFFIGHHTDDILCLALDKTGKIAATGEIGKSPKICVWDVTTLECLAVLTGFHERGVCCIAFSADGNTLVSVGLDDNHSIAVWNWRKGIKIASDKGSQEKIMSVQFDPFSTEGQFVSVGIKHIKFWKAAGNGLVSKNGIFGQKGAQQTMLAITFDKEFTYTGANSGEIYKWKGNNLEATMEAHKGPCFTLSATKDGFLSGGKDGKVIVWGPGFKQQRVIDVTKALTQATTAVSEACIKSVFSNGAKILIGTRDGDILEAPSTGEAKLILGGHGMGELWGLATHPSKLVFATASDDKTVRVWDIATKKEIAMKELTKAARSVAYSPDGSMLAVGFITGKFTIYKADNLEEITSKTDRKEAIHEIKFSPNGKLVAVGSHDNFVDIYEVGDKWARVGRCSGNSSYITHVDWSSDSTLIGTNSGAYEHLYFQAPSGKRITINSAAEKNIQWATWTGVLGDVVGGIWPKNSDGTDVNSVDRSHSGDSLATADDFGMVKLFSFPAPDGAKFKEFRGHSAHVTNVRFTHNDSHLISIGGGDTAIFLWGFKHSEEGRENQVVEEHYDSDIEKEVKTEYVSRAEKIEEFQQAFEPADDTQDSGFSIQLDTTSDVVKAAPPKKGGIAKSEHEYVQHDNESSVNIKSLDLDFIYGYRGHDTRNNLWYLDSGEVVFHAAAAGIVYNPKTNTQKFMLEHTDDIVSLAYHPETGMVATGQVGKAPTIIVWDAKTQKSEAVLKGFHTCAVCALGFSKNGKMLVSVGLDNDHSVAVYKWKEGIQVAAQKGAPEKIFDVAFNPAVDTEFVTVGVKHVGFWKLAGNTLSNKRGIFGDVGQQTTMLCVTFAQNGIYTGAITGDIYHWVENKLTRVIKAGDGPIYTINPTPKGDFLSGGKDEKVIRWGPDFGAPKDTIKLPRNFGSSSPIRAVSESKEGKIIVGTATSEIYEIGTDKKPKLLIQGHADGELWGLSAHPSKNMFATSADDCTLRVWDIAQHQLVGMEQLNNSARSVDFSPDGKRLAVGGINGSFTIHEVGTMKEVQKKRNRKEAIHEIKFSPDGKYLAVGSHDNFVDLYSTEDYKLLGTCKGSSSYITHVDWTKDSAYVQTNSGAHEHLMYEAPTGKHITDRKLVEKLHRFADWQTWTGVLGDLVDGIWPKGSDITDVNSVCVMKNGTTLATGDDFGFVKLFEFPCKTRGAEFKKYAGHSAHVTNVRFNFDDSYLISIGGGDRCIFQWKVRK